MNAHYRLRTVRAVLPSIYERTRGARTLRHTKWLELSASVFFVGKRSPLSTKHPDLSRTQRDLEHNALSIADRRRLAGDALGFLRWLRLMRVRVCNVDSDTVCVWLAYIAESLKPIACIHAYTAVRLLLRIRGMPDPSATARVAACLAGIRRQQPRSSPKHYDWQRYRNMVLTCDGTLTGRRDKVLVHSHFAGLCARSLRNLRWDHIEFLENGDVVLRAPDHFSFFPTNDDEAMCIARAFADLYRYRASANFVLFNIRDYSGPLSQNQIQLILRDRCSQAGYPNTNSRDLRTRFLWEIGELGFDDTLFAAMANFKNTENGRHYNLTATPRKLGNRVRTRRGREERMFVGFQTKKTQKLR